MEHLLQQLYDQVSAFHTTHPKGVVILWGPTATGKSTLAVELAKQLPIEIISADSRQVYVGMDIGTDKVSSEIRKEIPHHMIDIVTPDQVFTAGQWKQQVTEIIDKLHQTDKLPLVVGGTGLYIDTLYKNYSIPEVTPQPERRAEMMEKEKEKPGFLFTELQWTDPDEARRHHPNSLRYLLRALEIFHVTGQTKSQLAHEQPVQWPLLMIGLRREKEDTNRRINARVLEMFSKGLVEEVKGLLAKGYTDEMPAMEGIGYKEIIGYLQGAYGIDKAEELLKKNSHRYAKRQRSRFRRYIAEGKAAPKENVTYIVHYLDPKQG